MFLTKKDKKFQKNWFLSKKHFIPKTITLK